MDFVEIMNKMPVKAVEQQCNVKCPKAVDVEGWEEFLCASNLFEKLKG